MDLSTRTILDSFYRVVNLKSSMREGGRVDGDTIMWWMGLPDSVRHALLTDEATLLEVALKAFSAWVRETTIEGMWGYGAEFDNVVLEAAYLRKGWTPPWSYKESRCLRTLTKMFPEIEMVREGEAHNALDDAITQGRHLIRLINHLNPVEETGDASPPLSSSFGEGKS